MIDLLKAWRYIARKAVSVSGKSTQEVLVVDNGVINKTSLPIFAHVSFDGENVGSLIASYNVSSVVRDSKGTFTINFTDAHTSANYTTLATAGTEDYSGTGASARGCGILTRTATSVSVVCERRDDAVNEDNNYINVLVLR